MNVIYFISDFSATYLLCQHCRETGFHRNFSLKEQIRDVTGSSILKGRGRNNIPRQALGYRSGSVDFEEQKAL
ncbi:MAG: hypothetical protein J7L16_03110 [Deltaproteobacteria bacterium]|nr:hypothetical protein [Deltaproteobacteria bacterium]